MTKEDDTATGPYWREELPPHLRDHGFFADTPTRAEGQAFFDAWFAKAYPSGKITAHADREGATAEAKAGDLQDRAKAFAQSLIDSVPPAERVRLAAAPIKSRSGARPYSTDFDPRYPAWVEERHAPFAREATGRKFTEVALKMGHSTQFGNIIRGELTLLALCRSEEPQYGGICDGRKKYADPLEGPVASTVFPILWEAHERALVESEQRGIVRALEPSPLRSPKAALLALIFEKMTLAKTGRHHSNVRALFKALAVVIAACRKECAP